MKKYLFLISSAALLASCSNELLVSEDFTQDETKTQGISFVLNDDVTRGIIKTNEDGSVSSQFFAESDRMSVFSNALKNGSRTYWHDVPAQYKATKSVGNPMIAAASDANILTFRGGASNNFIVAYPYGELTRKRIQGSKVVFTPTNGNAKQTYRTNTCGFENRLLIGTAVVNGDSVTYDKAGFNDQIQLSMKSPYAAMSFNVSDIEKYLTLFGTFDSIEFKPVNTTAYPVVLQSSDELLVDTASSEIYALPLYNTLPVRLNWTPDTWNKNSVSKTAYILPASRGNMAQQYEVICHFKNIVLTWKQSTQKDWKANTVYYDTLSIAKTFPYLITKGSGVGANDRVLYVNSGKVGDIALGGSDNFVWNDENCSTPNSVGFDEICAVYIADSVKKMSGSNDWAPIKSLSNCTYLSIANNTDTLLDISGMSNLIKLDAPKIKVVAENSLTSPAATLEVVDLAGMTSYQDQTRYTKLDSLNIGSYSFLTTAEDDYASLVFFNNNTKSTLQFIDIHSVTSLNTVFGYQRIINFKGYSALKYVKLNNASGTILNSQQFYGCSSLENVNGRCIIGVDTPEAFYSCANLHSVTIMSDTIPQGSFQGSGIWSVLDTLGKRVVPKYIGSYAFEGSPIDSMDVSKATIIGTNAFNGCTNFVGGFENRGVVTIIAETIPEQAFNGTSVVRFQLKNCKAPAAYSLNSSALQQIKYRAHGATHTGCVADPSTIQIFVKDLDGWNEFSPRGWASVKIDDTDWK